MAVSKVLPSATRGLLAEATERYHEALLEDDHALDYLGARGIDLPEIYSYQLGLVVDPIPDHESMTGRIAIPYLVPRGGPVGMKFRCLRHSDCKAVECPKYLAHTGMGQRLYNVGALKVASDVIAITEGELDAIVATEAGIPAVAVPGVKGWADAWAFCFEGYRRVLVIGDGDEAGRSFAERLADHIDSARAVPMPDGHDVTSLVLEQGPEALRERCT
ncbi:toprim domain-containing protein [Pseudonocardia sp. NPDC049154]|uniref:toprim domain-containing protein n=1 Tax=Pseudonocardia sp. NPDC049154 TaxID=3155501 RepID=UPI0033E90C8B